ncbi:MAG: muconolactone Delta-isomerase family protein [Candidatus Bathyarchaeota archaeon]|nr:muconolactone Delta-isomerase family protein [Candidatus Bathyarchaeota archaeon]
MKFLILQRIRGEVPVEAWAKLLPAQFKYLDKLEREGKVEVSYHLIGQQGNLLIVDVDSDDELSKIVGEDPLFFHSQREVYPLTTRETHKKQLKQILGL